VEINVGDNSPSNEEFGFQTVGEQLKAERERRSLSLSDLAAKTKVPMRHLEAIEKSEFSALPGTTYTLGFARSYARALEMDAAKLSADLRLELAQGGHDGYQAPTQNYEPTDPANVPSKALAWAAAAIGILVVAAYLFWRSYTLTDAPAEIPQTAAPAVATTQTVPAAGSTTAVNAGGDVVLTATDSVWVKIYDAENKRLFESEMKPGDKFTVPQDANNPMILTGRPQALAVTVGGKPIPTLGAPDRTVVDVGVSAASLMARKPEQPMGSAAATGDAANPASAVPAPN
jgi:cytoskeletal protein RodZ